MMDEGRANEEESRACPLRLRLAKSERFDNIFDNNYKISSTGVAPASRAAPGFEEGLRGISSASPN